MAAAGSGDNKQSIHPADCCAPAKTNGGEVDSMSIKELKAFLIERAIDFSDCLEKSDFVSRVKQAIKDGVKKPTSAGAAGAASGAASGSRTCLLASKEVGPLKCNMCIIGDPISKRAVLVDPGGDTTDILHLIKTLGVTIEQILITHAHFDHIASAGDIKHATGATICMSKSDLQLWQLFPMQYALIGLPAPKNSTLPAAPDHFLADGESLKGSISGGGRAIHTPGHSPGSMCYYWAEQKLICTGDTLFRLSVGRTDLLGGDANALKSSIQHKLYSLPDDTEVIPGHGERTSIGFEKANNMVVRAPATATTAPPASAAAAGPKSAAL